MLLFVIVLCNPYKNAIVDSEKQTFKKEEVEKISAKNKE